jgi:hypothetical protein
MIEFPTVTSLTGSKEADNGLFGFVVAEALRKPQKTPTARARRKPWLFMTPLQRWQARQRKLRRILAARLKWV